MKIVNSMKKSLSNKVLFLFGMCSLFFIVGTGSLFYIQHQAQVEYVEKRENIQGKLKIINDIYEPFHSQVLVMSNSVAIRVPITLHEAIDQEKSLRQELNEFSKLIKTKEESSIHQNIDDFINYYFTEVIPTVLNDYEQHHDPSVNLSNNDVHLRVNEFLESMNSTINKLNYQLTNNAAKFAEEQSNLQNSLILFLILFLIVLLITLWRMFKSVGKPLAEFTHSANEIAAGRETVINVDSNRKDELGTLSIAFQKMLESIHYKEQDLVAHNEELIAQQDELEAQQQELRATLEILTEKEQKLVQRNELIKGISSSLNKEEVLQSIVNSMCKITCSDKGIIAYLHEEVFASYGISDSGVKQFISNLNSDLILRLTNEKKAYTVKREQHLMEKGYHETLQYSYDIYLPVISSSEIKAILVFTRYGVPFTEKEINEYEILAIQIAIYLEKISLFEQSEEDRRLSQDILNTVQEGIQLIDKDRKIILVNQQLGSIFEKIAIDEMLGLSWDRWSRFMADQIEEVEFIELMENLINSAYLSSAEEHSFVYRKNNGKQVIRVYCKTFKKDCNEDFGSLLVHRDITKEYEIAKTKSEIVSTVSHELRTPLASVLGFTELLLNKELKPERKTKYLQTIYNEAKRLTALINDFLDIQRMESGKQTYEKKFIDITSILQNVIELQKVNTSSHKIQFSVELEETIILGDRMKIEQVFTNLLNNAIKYSPKGGNIFIRVYGSEDMISIDVKDEGLGIPEDAIPHLFQQFYRVDNSDRRRIGGTGLGLAIVQEIVKAHGGVITVSSEYGKSSTFTTHFPHVMMKVNKQNDYGAASMLRYKIMVVEDDLSLAELLSHELQDSGLNVIYHNNGIKALEKMKIEPPDAVVLDIMLDDGMDGWTIMKEMKASEELKDIPIFVSTAVDDKEQGFSLGAQDYLIKPYQPSQLSKLIMHTLLSNERNGQILLPHQDN
ncbi:ATP-binding protein [Lederbergia citri]|uniref:histidine kinase n=1 Tax=Lederbergia citri TaxID=2833580 RepID=A0A942YHY2_9BACI|nr:ATP-binding protein [Lederbergia citri]MBS4197763.1 response regulator [Lederbergia citri]